MKRLLFPLFLLLFSACNSETTQLPYAPTTTDADTKEEKKEPFTPVIKQFQAVWDKVASDKLGTLPQESVSYAKLFDGAIDLITQNAQRTLTNQEDILPYFDKLAHPNGVCLRGLWKIDKENPYSGFFKKGSESLIIARASSAMSETKRGEKRAFGMAGKLFGTIDPQKINSTPSANFFVIDDLGGTDLEYYTDTTLTNEPEVSFTSSIFTSLRYGYKVATAFADADKNSGIRQLYEISYLGEETNSSVLTPKWIQIEALPNQTKYGVDDFRDEFALKDGEKLTFSIAVASREVDGEKLWQEIGSITFDASVVSTTCDHQLHFHHPLWRDDLVYE